MFKYSALLCIAAALLAAPIAFAGSSATDRADAAYVCARLQNSATDPQAFVVQFRVVARCVAKWLPVAHTVRTSVSSSCSANGLSGAQLTNCITAQTHATLDLAEARASKAARTCSLQFGRLGQIAFTAKYGRNPSPYRPWGNALRAAFDRCVSRQLGGKLTVGGAPSDYTYTASAINGSGVSAKGKIELTSGELVTSTSITGSDAGAPHAVVILTGTSTCSAAAGIDRNGTVSLPNDALLFWGLVPSRIDSVPFHLSLFAPLPPLRGKSVLILGKTVNGSYDEAYPVACGTIS